MTAQTSPTDRPVLAAWKAYDQHIATCRSFEYGCECPRCVYLAQRHHDAITEQRQARTAAVAARAGGR